MKWQEQKIIGFFGINNTIKAQKEEFEILSNLVTDILPNELTLFSGYEIYKDFSDSSITVDYFLFLDGSKRYLITIDNKGTVRVDSTVVGAISDYTKNNFTYHKVNESIRFSNGSASWFLGEVEGSIYFEKQFRYDGLVFSEAVSYIDVETDNTASVVVAGKYEYLVIYKIDGYQYVKGAKRASTVEVDSRLRISFKVENISKRVNTIYLYYRNVNESNEFTLLFSKDVKDFELASDKMTRIYNQKLADTNTLSELVTGTLLEKASNGIITFIQDSRYYDTSGNLKSFSIGLVRDSSTYNVIMNTIEQGVYKFTSEGNFSVFIPFNLVDGKRYRIEIDITAYLTKYFTRTVKGSYAYGDPPIDFVIDNFSYEPCFLELKNTIDLIEYKVNTNKGTAILDFTPTQSLNGFTLFGSFISSTTDDPIRKRWQKYNQLPMGYLVFNRVLLREYSGIDEQTSISALTGYQIATSTTYVTGWSRALQSNGKTHFINPILGEDKSLFKNRICRSIVSSSGATMYDIATGGDFLSVEEFDGDEIKTAEVLPQQRDIIAFKGKAIKVINSNGYVYELSGAKSIANKRALCKMGDNICFATGDGIFAVNGQKIEELSIGIRELYRKFNKENIILATDFKGRLHIADGVNEELILTETGWTMYAQINTYYLNVEPLYLLSNNKILRVGNNNTLQAEFLTSSFDTFKIGEFNYNTSVVLNGVWIYGEYEAITNPILIVKTNRKALEYKCPISLSGKFLSEIIPVENAQKVQIGLKGNFKNIRISSLGFNWKPMATI